MLTLPSRCPSPPTVMLNPSPPPSRLKGNWLDTLAYVHLNATLWRRIAVAWPGASGDAAFKAELASFRELRATVQASCNRCERAGPSACLAAASRAPRHAPPHFCWQLRQDTSSWSEHFFSRMALRFDAVAAANEVTSVGEAATAAAAPASGRVAVRRRGAREEQMRDSGVITGGVKWWRCRDGRQLRDGCTRKFNARGGSAWDCLCSW